MANNNNNKILQGIKNLTNITRSTNKQTYGVSRDVPKILSKNVYDEANKISQNIANDKAIINNHMSRTRYIKNRNENSNIKDLYSIINDEEMVSSLSTMIGTENYKLNQTLKDYEIVKRCIPQIHKVIVNLKNSIISPDAMADSAIGLELPSDIEAADKDRINNIIEKYKLNEKLDNIVQEYLIAANKVLTVVPYNMIPDMLESKNINECISELENELGESKSLLECSGMGIDESEILTESINVEYYENQEAITKNLKTKHIIDSNEYKTALNECLSNIEFIDGGMNYFKRALLNEAIAEARVMNNDNDKSMKTILKNLKSKSKTIDITSIASEGLIDQKTAEDIRKNVEFKGCHIEELPVSRVIAFRLRDTLIGYFYVEDKVSPLDSGVGNKLSSIMDKINASVYIKQANDTQASKIENMVIKSISERLISSIDSKFLNDNYDDMDIIYEFVRINEIHKKNKRVTFFHPNDICEFKRKDGSIMKNCMFMAKLYLLTLLTNILANATRGADRQIHYVKTGLTTDIEGSVHSTIRAIKQNQIRYSDIGTINDIFNICGSMVDVFMPISVDGERPIETETISGQNIDMNNDFLSFLLKSIIQSFGLPSSIIDDFDNLDFAKTIPMSNLEMAKAVLDSQNELNEPLTKLIRLIVSYELPDFEQVNEIYAKLTPPLVIVIEMNKERMESVNQIAEMLSTIMIPQNDQETITEMMQRKFRELYNRKNLPTLDWDAIDEIMKELNTSVEIEQKKKNIKIPQQDTNSGNDYSNY